MRSWLFVPGDAPDKMEKALKSPADVVIFDLEDSVAPDNKDRARETTADVLKTAKRPAGKIFVRVNPFQSGLTGPDAKAVDLPSLDGYMLPKSESGKDVERLNALTTSAKDIIAIATETAHAVFGLGTYKDIKAPLTALTWGAEDLSSELGASATREQNDDWTAPYKLARNLCLFAAHAASVAAIDTVYTDFKNEGGLKAECEKAARDGFIGKMAIHPAQVPIINAAFTPDDKAVASARRLVEAFKKQGEPGVISLDGKMYDLPHLKNAEKLLARASHFKSC